MGIPFAAAFVECVDDVLGGGVGWPPIAVEIFDDFGHGGAAGRGNGCRFPFNIGLRRQTWRIGPGRQVFGSGGRLPAIRMIHKLRLTASRPDSPQRRVIGRVP